MEILDLNVGTYDAKILQSSVLQTKSGDKRVVNSSQYCSCSVFMNAAVTYVAT